MKIDPVERLPQMLRLIGRAADMTAVIKFVTDFGGMRVYVPQSVEEDHRMTVLIGTEAMRVLVEAYGGDKVEVPSRAAIATRKGSILIDNRPHGVVAHELGVSHSWVKKVRRRHRRGGLTRRDKRQRELFED